MKIDKEMDIEQEGTLLKKRVVSILTCIAAVTARSDVADAWLPENLQEKNMSYQKSIYDDMIQKLTK